MVVEVTFSEIELAEDLKALISLGSNKACEDDALKGKIMAFGDDCLLNVQKSIASPPKIIGADEVTDEMMEAAL